MAASPPGAPPLPHQVVVVTGAGRSGTSTVAGALSRLGYLVPQPEVQANRSNPRGFYESRWVVDFHASLLAAGDATALDTRPGVEESLRRIGSRPVHRDRLRDWLPGQLEAGNLVIKDPRTFWFLDLWEETAALSGAQTVCLTMLRHPAEVVGSRDEYYSGKKSADERAAGEIANLAGWVNCSLINERITRGRPRIFLRYPDLLADWRTCLGEAASALHLQFTSDITARRHPIDKFIDSDLRRVRATWQDRAVPTWLRDLADEAWSLLSGAEGSLQDPSIQRALDDLAARYTRDFSEAIALSRDHTRAAARRARRQARRRVTEELTGSGQPTGGNAPARDPATPTSARTNARPGPWSRLRHAVTPTRRRSRSRT